MAREKWSDGRKIISMPASLVERVKRFRFAKEINTESEAIRRLIELGLEVSGFPSAETGGPGIPPSRLSAENDD